MPDALSFSTSNESIGFKTRKRGNGPESELVEAFAERVALLYGSRKERVAIFYEPRLENGFPDIVICVYDPRHFEEWAPTRIQIQVQDLKVLHHLHLVGRLSADAASTQLGVRDGQMARTLENLHSAGLVRPYGKKWCPISLKRAFGIKRLVAVEAKMGDWTGVFRQACANRWFASETYALSPVQRPSAKVIQRSSQLGIGIYTCAASEVVEVRPSVRSLLPSCYASWLFNEWIGRGLNKSEPTESSSHVPA